jgi:YnbE-like lipoprotein
MRRILSIVGAAASVWAAAGCVQVVAPDKPIEINLNVTIRQEVVVRLEGQARDLLQDNPDLF